MLPSIRIRTFGFTNAWLNDKIGHFVFIYSGVGIAVEIHSSMGVKG